MLCQGVVMARRGWGGGSLVLWVQGCWALDEGGGTLAAVLNEVQVVMQLPPRLLTTYLCTQQQLSQVMIRRWQVAEARMMQPELLACVLGCYLRTMITRNSTLRFRIPGSKLQVLTFRVPSRRACVQVPSSANCDE